MTNDLYVLVHGFNVMDGGKKTVGKLGPHILRSGAQYEVLDYGFFGLLSVRFLNKGVARRLKEVVSNAYSSGYNRVFVVGHSNGCTIAYLASNMDGFRCDGFIFINPALKQGLAPGEGVPVVNVWHSPSDRPVKLSRILARITVGNGHRPWGRMGAIGYIGDDKRVINYNKQDDFTVSSIEHSDVFDPEKLVFFAPRFIEAIQWMKRIPSSVKQFWS